MKPLTTKTVDGRVFHPCYIVNDWGTDGWFLGVDYQRTAMGTHSLGMQTDRRLTAPVSVDALWPNGLIWPALVAVIGTREVTVGRDTEVSSPIYGLRCDLNGAPVTVRADLLWFDLDTLVEVPS